MHIYSNNTTRVDVHIACIREKKSVDQFMTRTRSYTPDCIYLYLCILEYYYICIVMPIKLKPSTKDYVRDSRGRMTNKWTWKHYTVSNTNTEELQKMYTSPSYSRKKNVIKRELERRGISI